MLSPNVVLIAEFKYSSGTFIAVNTCDGSTLPDEHADPLETRTHKIFQALDLLAHEFDLPVPIWLDTNIRDFKRNSKTRFYQDSFVEQIPFDFLEIQVIEED